MTTPVGLDVAEAVPPAFVAITTTSTVSSTSPDCNVYVDPLAPAMFVHPLLAQSRH
jgi:hypothetical protein